MRRKILVTGAYGFIGSAVTARLLADGHEVVGLGRNVAQASRQQPDVRWISLDIAKASNSKDWLPHLSGIQAVVNCAGALQDGGSDDIRAVHVDGTVALFEACEKAGVRRVIHVSAIGIDRQTPTKFSATKLAADRDLQKRNLEWVILRPSVVYGRNAYGGSALIRAAAALPGFVPVFPDTADLQLVHLDDVAETAAFFVKDGAPAKVTLELAGPERLSLTQTIKSFRRWLGLSETREIKIPRWIAAAAFKLGDAISWLGWRPPVRTTAQRELARGAIGDPAEWTRITGISPRSLSQALAREPASVQEKWFARLYLFKSLLIGGLALFWIATGLLALGPAREAGIVLMLQAGLAAYAVPLVFGGAILDILVGLGIAMKRTARAALLASIAVSLLYLALGGILLPALWADPLGPLVKIVPVLLASLAALAILDDR
jgi:uncharacterized protein YbjT (DUF2867 family)